MHKEHHKGDEASEIETEMRVRAQIHLHNQSSNSNHKQDSSLKEEAVEVAGDVVEEVVMVLGLVHSQALPQSLSLHPYKKPHIGVEEVDVEGGVVDAEEAAQSVLHSGWLLGAANLEGS